jgi:hypothetical protein
MPSEAKKEYKKALEIFEDRIENPDKNIFANKLNHAITLIFLGVKEEGKKEIEKLIIENPENKEMYMLFQKSTKEELIKKFYLKN